MCHRVSQCLSYTWTRPGLGQRQYRRPSKIETNASSAVLREALKDRSCSGRTRSPIAAISDNDRAIFCCFEPEDFVQLAGAIAIAYNEPTVGSPGANSRCGNVVIDQRLEVFGLETKGNVAIQTISVDLRRVALKP